MWVDKARTGQVAGHKAGVTVSLLHTGRHYADDLSEDGLIYHYPETNRGDTRDAAEVEATKSAGELEMPLFVILPGPAFPSIASPICSTTVGIPLRRAAVRRIPVSPLSKPAPARPAP